MKNSAIADALRIIRSTFSRSGRDNASYLQKNSRRIFLREFLIILLICLVLVGAFFVIHSRTILSMDKDNRLDAYRLDINSMSQSFDNLVCFCLDNAVSTARSSITITGVSLMASEPWFWGQTLVRARNDLGAVISGIGVFSEAMIYVQNADLFITSSGVNGSMLSVPPKYRGILIDYLDARVSVQEFTFQERAYRLFNSSGNYVICTPVYSYDDNDLSLLFLVLNIDGLGRQASTIFIPELSSIRISIADPFGDVVIGEAMGESGFTAIDKESDIMKWRFRMYIPDDALLPSTSTWISHSLALGVILVVGIVLICLFVSAILHRPMFNAAKALSEAGIEPGGEEANEALSATISRMSSYQKDISSAIRLVSDDVKTKLFYDLLSGKSLSFTYVENSLKGISSGFSANALYFICAMFCSSPERSGKISEVLRDAVSTLEDSHGVLTVVVPMEERLFAVVVQLKDPDASIMDGKTVARQVLRTIMENAQKKDPDVQVNAGPLYHSIMDIGFSFTEAKNAIDYDEQAAVETGETLKPRVGQILRWYSEGSSDEADEMLDLTVSEILADDQDGKVQARRFKELLVDGILSCPDIDHSGIPDVLSGADEDMDLLGSCTRLADFFKARIRARNNPYVVKARTYIAENYADKNLSQTGMAEVLGITSSYLSRLFVSCLGINYVEYVARVRVEAAVKLIKETDRPVSEIADLCGFASSRNFIYSFRKQYGTTPGNWRKEQRQA